MAIPLPIPPKIFHPRAIVIIQAIFDDQIPGSPGAPATWTSIPRNVEVRRNSARKADTCTIELDYRDFPLDPRMLKDLLVTVHIEDVLSGAAGPLPIVPTPLNKRFVGLVDMPETTMGPTEEVVRLNARDFTGIYLDFRWGDVSIPIFPATLNSVVELLRVRVTPLTLPALFTDPIAAFSDVGTRLGKTLYTPGKNDTAWDVLTDICALFGLVPVWDLDVLTIRTASAPSLGQAVLVYGQNVEQLKFSRNFKQPSQRQVKVVAWNPVLGIPQFAVFPPVAAITRLDESGKPKITIKQVQYNVEGAYTVFELTQLAQRVYEEMSQHQIEGELKTREMQGTDLVSLLGLSNGDRLICRLGPDLQASIEGKTPAEAIAFLSDPTRPNALNPVAAQALVTAWTLAQTLAITFYVSEAIHRWDRRDGYTLAINFLNFILGV